VLATPPGQIPSFVPQRRKARLHDLAPVQLDEHHVRPIRAEDAQEKPLHGQRAADAAVHGLLVTLLVPLKPRQELARST
jgi:hypothetical protein